jgi:hypothetical protein
MGQAIKRIFILLYTHHQNKLQLNIIWLRSSPAQLPTQRSRLRRHTINGIRRARRWESMTWQKLYDYAAPGKDRFRFRSL